MDLIGQIKKIQPSVAVLMLSIYSEELYAIKALKFGASGYLTKSSAPEELLTAIDCEIDHPISNPTIHQVLN